MASSPMKKKSPEFISMSLSGDRTIYEMVAGIFQYVKNNYPDIENLRVYPVKCQVSGWDTLTGILVKDYPRYTLIVKNTGDRLITGTHNGTNTYAQMQTLTVQT